MNRTPIWYLPNIPSRPYLENKTIQIKIPLPQPSTIPRRCLLTHLVQNVLAETRSQALICTLCSPKREREHLRTILPLPNEATVLFIKHFAPVKSGYISSLSALDNHTKDEKNQIKLAAVDSDVIQL